MIVVILPQMVREMLRFNKVAKTILDMDPADPRRNVSLGQWLKDHNFKDSLTK